MANSRKPWEPRRNPLGAGIFCIPLYISAKRGILKESDEEERPPAEAAGLFLGDQGHLGGLVLVEEPVALRCLRQGKAVAEDEASP